MIPLLLHDLETLFGWLLAASWQASVLVVFVLLIQRVLGSRLNPRWRYALWLLVLARLVLPALPESALSLFQFAPPPPAALTVSVTEPLFIAAPIPSPNVSTTIPPLPTHPFSAYSLLAVLWLAGALVLLVLTWQVNRRFARQIAHSPAISDPELLKLFAEAKAELGIHRAIRLIENGQVQSPAIMGLFQPTLLLPADVRGKFDATELRLIFLHELAHLKRGDVIVQGIIALLQILHWFNPVLWFAFRRMRIDREPATDALVLSRTGEEEKERYGLMLIKLLEHFNRRHSLPTLVGILEDRDQFKRRFSLIARFTRGAYSWSLLGVFIIALLSVACLTKSKAKEITAHNKGATYAVKRNIVATVFWIGKTFPYDSPETLPRPFYAALPFNDVAHPEAAKIVMPSTWFKPVKSGEKNHSNCIDHWLKITNHAGIPCYAQWEDFGPGPDDDADYVFGNKPPKFQRGNGIDLSPGTANFLGIDNKNKIVSWQFVDKKDVPPGPWLSDQPDPEKRMPLGTDAADETYFNQALERDRTMIADSSIKSSTLAADAQMLGAIQRGDVAALKKVLEHAVDPNTFDPDRFHSSPVYWAVHFDQPEALKLLLEHMAKGSDGPANDTPLQLAQKNHPDFVPIIEEGIKRNRAILTAQLTAKLHSIHIDLPAFSGVPMEQVVHFLMEATSKAGYLERRVTIGTMDAATSATITSPAIPNISIWDALQAIADANKLRFDVDCVDIGCITFYPPSDGTIIHPPAAKPDAPSKADATVSPPPAATGTTAVALSQPTAEAPDKIPAGQVKLTLQVMQIGEADYQAHRGDIDAAVQKGDPALLSRFKSFDLVMQSSVVEPVGKRIVFAINDDKRNLVLACDLDARPDQGKIAVTGKLAASSIQGDVPFGKEIVPNIVSREVNLFGKLDPGQTKALQATSIQGEIFPPVASDKSSTESGLAKTPRRLFLFLTAWAGPALPETSTGNAPPSSVKAEAGAPAADSIPSPGSEKLLREPGLSHLNLDFKTEMTRFLLHFLG